MRTSRQAQTPLPKALQGLFRRLVRKATLTGMAVFGSFFMVSGLAAELGDTSLDAPAADLTKHHEPGELLVRFNSDVSDQEVRTFAASHGIAALSRLTDGVYHMAFSVSVPIDKIIEELGDAAEVSYVEPNYLLFANQLPNDGSFSTLWGLHNTGQSGGKADADIDAAEAWDLRTDASSIIVGVIDTGVDYNHPDLAANMWTNTGEIAGNNIDDDGNGYVDDVHGYDFVNNDGDPMDDHYHGTHVAGTIGGVGNNGVGVTGVAWKTKIMALKFLSSGGYGSSSDAIKCIKYANQMGAMITNNSWGGGGYSSSLKAAIDEAKAKGYLFMAAAGNSTVNNDSTPHYPSSYDSDNIIAVASSTSSETQSGFSNYGATSVDLHAPGSVIYSTAPNNTYKNLSGTSMATPHVAGAAALVWADKPGLSYVQVRDKILNSVDPVPAFSGKSVTGGRLNVHQALLSGSELVPPDAISDLAIDGVASGSFSLSWSATGDDGKVGKAKGYDLRYSTSPIDANNFKDAQQFASEPQPAEPGTKETMTLNGLFDDTTYYVALRAIDDAGNYSGISNVPSAKTSKAAVIKTFDMETGAGDWTISGLWHLSQSRSNSPSHAFYYGDETSKNYDKGTNSGLLTSPAISLTTATSASLEFMHWRQVESYAGNYDQTYVRVSSDGGSTWQEVWQKSAKDPSQASWVKVTGIDLSNYLGKTIRVQFGFNSVDAVSNKYEGWYVDDLRIMGSSAGDNVPPAPPTGLVVKDLGNGDSLDLSWDANSENDLAGYNVYRDSAKINAALLQGKAYADSGLTKGTGYTYFIKAEDSSGNESSASASVTAVPGAPDAPVLTAATAGNAKATLTWNASSQADVSGYNVYSKTAGSAGADTNWALASNGGAAMTNKGSNIKALNDGVTATTANGSHAHWPSGEYLMVKLPNAINIGKIVVHLFDGNTAYYRYLIEVSSDGINWTEVVNRSTGEQRGMQTETLSSPVQGQYVKIIGINNWQETTLSVKEMEVYESGSSWTKVNSALIGKTTYEVTGLENGKEVTFAATAVDIDSKESDKSNEKSVTPDAAAAPGAPTNLAINDPATGSSLTLSWGAAGGDVSGYTVYRDGGKVNGLLTANTSYTDTGVSANTNYSYYVTATNADGVEGAASATVKANPGAPAKPGGFTGSAGNAKASLSWTANSEGDLAGYNVYRDGAKVNSAAITATSYADSGLSNGKSYSYQVSAVDTSNNEGGKSNAVNVVPDKAAAPTTPGGLTVTDMGSGGVLNLSWSANGESDLAGYNLYRDGAKLGSLLGTPSYKESGLTEGQTYGYQVTAVNNEGSESGKTAAVKAAPGAPDAPVQKTATAGNSSAQLSWTAPSQEDVAGYNVYSKSSGTAQADAGINWGLNTNGGVAMTNKGSNIKALNDGVTATNVNGSHAHWPSGEYLMIKLGKSVAMIKFVVHLFDGNTAFYRYLIEVSSDGVNWTTAVDKSTGEHKGVQTDTLAGALTGQYVKIRGINNNSETTLSVKEMEVYASETSWTKVNTSLITGVSSNMTGLTNGKSYTYAVTAVDNWNFESSKSNEQSVTPDAAAAPGAPTNFAISDPNTGTSLGLSWTASTGANISGYNVYRDGKSVNGSLVTSTSFTDTGLVAGSNYSYQVAGVNGDGAEGAKSSAVTGNPGAPSAPKSLAGSAGNAKANLSWNNNPEKDLAGYNIYRDGSKVNSAVVTSAGYTDSGLTNGTSYSYQVSAQDASGNEGSKSSAVGVTPDKAAAPATPSSFSVTDSGDGTSVSMSWSANSEGDLAGYNVYRDGIKRNGSTVTATGYSDTGLTQGSNYSYQVAAVNNEGSESDKSTAVKVAPGAPDAPTLTLASIADTTASLVWDAPSQQDVAGYNVYTKKASNDSGTTNWGLASNGALPITNKGSNIKALNDGVTATSVNGAHAHWPSGEYLMIKLANSIEVGKIVVHLFDGNTAFYRYLIEVSTDGTNWVEVVNRSTGEWKGVQTETLASAVTGQFVKIRGINNFSETTLSVKELEVYAAGSSWTKANTSLIKTTSTTISGLDASKAHTFAITAVDNWNLESDKSNTKSTGIAQEASDNGPSADGSYFLEEASDRLPQDSGQFHRVQAGDIDGDGKPDVFTPGSPKANLYLQGVAADGAIAFSQAWTQTENWQDGLLVDLDADGDLDLAGLQDNVLVLMTNAGNGFFEDATASMLQGAAGNPNKLHAADLDADGAVDLVLAGDTTGIWMNNGSGLFFDETAKRLPAGIAGDLQLADVDQDGLADMLQGDGFQTAVLKNDGSGYFAQDLGMLQGLAGSGLLQAGMADLNGDGLSDLLSVNADNQVQIHLALGTGAFEAPTTLLDAGDTRKAVAVDLDNDGAVDVLAASYDALTFLRNQGDGTWADQTAGFFKGAITGPVQDIAVADMDNDSDQDLIVARGSASQPANNAIAFNDGYGVLNFDNNPLARQPAINAALGDLDADGNLDIVLVREETVELLHNDAAGNFSASTLQAEALAAGSMDANEDGLMDLYLVGATQDTLWVQLSDGTFQNQGIVDSHAELASARVVAHEAGLLMTGVPQDNWGSIEFVKITAAAGSVQAQDLSLGSARSTRLLSEDLDGNGFADVVSVQDSGDMQVAFQVGYENFLNATLPALPANVQDVAVLDADRDGLMDLVVYSDASTDPARLFLQTPAMGFEDATDDWISGTVSGGSHALRVDLACDGYSDAIAIGAGNVPTLLTHQGEVLAASGNLTSTTTPAASAALRGDVDGDGKDDILLISADPNSPNQLWMQK